MFSRNFLPASVQIIFPMDRNFENNEERYHEARLLSMLVYQLDHRVAVLN